MHFFFILRHCICIEVNLKSYWSSHSNMSFSITCFYQIQTRVLIHLFPVQRNVFIFSPSIRRLKWRIYFDVHWIGFHRYYTLESAHSLRSWWQPIQFQFFTISSFSQIYLSCRKLDNFIYRDRDGKINSFFINFLLIFIFFLYKSSSLVMFTKFWWG